MPLKNFVDNSLPVIDAEWLNEVDVIRFVTVPALTAFDARFAGTSATDGAGVPTFDIDAGYAEGTVGAELSRFLTPYQFGARGDASTDDTAALNLAITKSSALLLPLRIEGRFRITSTLTIPARMELYGQGLASDTATGSRSRSCIIKDFNGTGVLFSGDDASTDGIQYDSVVGRTGDNVQVTGSRFRAPSIAVTNAGQDGLRIGATSATGTGTSPINANLGYIGKVAALGCGRYGVNFDDTNTGGSGNYLLGVPNCNGWFVGLIECDRNVTGLHFGNALDNHIAYVVAQSNTGPQVYFSASARNHLLSKCYTELPSPAGGATDGLIDSGATQNVIWVSSRAVTLANGWTNNGGNSNLMMQHVSGVGQDGAFNSAPWVWGPEFYTYNAAASGQCFLGGYVESALLPGWWRVEKHATSGVKMTLCTKRDGDTIVDRLSVDSAGFMVLQNSTGFGLGKTANDVTNAGIYFGDVGSANLTRTNYVGSGSAADTIQAFYNSNGLVGSITRSGSATAFNTSSDYRLKGGVVAGDREKAYVAVMSWPVKEFHFLSNPAARQFGFVAHELAAVAPYAVSGEKDEMEERPTFDAEGRQTGVAQVIKPQGVDLSKLVPELIAMVQLLATEVAALKAQLAAA